MCLTCDNFDANRPPLSFGSTAPPTWVVDTEACQDCLDANDIEPGKCSKEVPATTTSPEVLPDCWIESASSCNGVDAVKTANECKNALRVAYPGLPISSFTSLESLVLPKGCSGKVIGGGVEGYFNHVGSGSNQAPCAGSDPRKITGSVDSSSIQSSLAVELYPDTNEAILKMTGPATAGSWFGFGFDAYRMADTPYTIIIEPGTTHVVSEWRLGGHNRGTLLESEGLRAWIKGDAHWMENGCAPTVATGKNVKKQKQKWRGKFIDNPEGTGLVQCCSFGGESAEAENDYETGEMTDAADESMQDDADSSGAKEDAQCFRQRQVYLESSQEGKADTVDGISSACYASPGSLVTFDEAEALCKADGKQLCSKEELLKPSASGCCHKGCDLDNAKAGAWTRDVRTPHDPRLKIVEYSTSDDGNVFSVTIIRNMTGETDDHFNFDVSDTLLNVIGAKGDSLGNGSFIDDCGDGDFDCYHGPRSKMSLAMELFEARSSCVCKQPCTTSTITETSTTSTTTTTKASGASIPLQTVVSFSGVNFTALSSAEKDTFKAAIESELARSLGVPEEDVAGLVSVIIGSSSSDADSSSTRATLVWNADTPTSSVDQVQSAMSASTFNVVFDGDSLSVDVVETAATTPSKGSAGGIVGGIVGGLIAVAIVLGASYYYVKIYKVRQSAASGTEKLNVGATRTQTNPAYAGPSIGVGDTMQI
jgi:hypothetical protein